MATVAKAEYHAHPDVPEVDFKNVPPRRSTSPNLDTGEVRDMNVMLEHVFGPHPDGYETGA